MSFFSSNNNMTTIFIFLFRCQKDFNIAMVDAPFNHLSLRGLNFCTQRNARNPSNCISFIDEFKRILLATKNFIVEYHGIFLFPRNSLSEEILRDSSNPSPSLPKPLSSPSPSFPKQIYNIRPANITNSYETTLRIYITTTTQR